MPKGKISNPGWITCTCQYCGKQFQYYRDTSVIRKSCYECIPDGRSNNAALIRRLIKKKAVEYKGDKCECCGKSYPLSVYDFHHKDPNLKDFSLGDKTSTVKWDKVKIEIDKCILVCANCHRQIHSGDIKLNQDQEEMPANNFANRETANGNPVPSLKQEEG